MAAEGLVKTAAKVLRVASVHITNYSNDDCHLAFHATTNSLIQTIRVVHVFACSVGALASALFVFVLLSPSSKNLHVNLRLSLASLSLAAFIACAQLLFTALYHSYFTLTEVYPCKALYDAQSCAFIRLPVVLAIYATLFGIFVLAAERSIATLKYKTYEVHGSLLLGVVLIALQWGLSTLIALFSLLRRDDAGFVHYCTIYVSHPKTAVLSLCAMTSLELVTLLLFASLLHINKTKRVDEFVNNALHTLTERYQLQENVRMIEILIPTVTVHASLSLLGLLALLLFAVLHSHVDSPLIVRFAPFSESVLLVVPIYAVFLPLVAIVKNQPLRQAARRALPWLFNKRTPVAVKTLAVEEDIALPLRSSKQLERDSDRHFGLLTEMWSR